MINRDRKLRILCSNLLEFNKLAKQLLLTINNINVTITYRDLIYIYQITYQLFSVYFK
jgi:hypothetical protein